MATADEIDIVTINVSDTSGLAFAGLGYPLILSKTAKSIASYTSMTGVVADWADTTPEYDIAYNILRGSRPPSKIYIAGDTGELNTFLDTLKAAGSLDDIYVITLSVTTEADVIAVAGWCYTNNKLLITDVAATTKPTITNPGRTALMYSPSEEYNASKWIGRCFNSSADGQAYPGVINWHNRKLPTPVVSTVSASNITTLVSNLISYVVVIGSENYTRGGYLQTADKYIDDIILQDTLVAKFKIALFNVLSTNENLTFNDADIGLLKGAVVNVMTEAVNKNAVSDFEVTFPLRADLEQADITARNYKTATVTYVPAGKVNTVTLNLNITDEIQG